MKWPIDPNSHRLIKNQFRKTAASQRACNAKQGRETDAATTGQLSRVRAVATYQGCSCQTTALLETVFSSRRFLRKALWAGWSYPDSVRVIGH